MYKKSMIIIFTLFLTGCGLRFVYNNLDFFVNWRLDDFVELNSEQQQAFDLAFKQIHQWHRKEQLPIYINQLTELKGQISAGITESEIEQHIDYSLQYWQDILIYTHDSLITVTAMLNGEQREEVDSNIQRDIAEIKSDHNKLTRVEWLDKRIKRQEKTFRKWTGKLTQTQKIALANIAIGYQESFYQWIDYREHWALAFKQALSMDNSYSDYEDQFSTLILNSQALREPPYQQIIANNRAVLVKSMHYVLHHLTEKQQRTLTKRINELIEDLNDLSENE